MLVMRVSHAKRLSVLVSQMTTSWLEVLEAISVGLLVNTLTRICCCICRDGTAEAQGYLGNQETQSSEESSDAGASNTSPNGRSRYAPP